MDYKSLKKINPQLIYAHISGYGNGTKRTAYDLVLQAETGFMHMNGTTASGPLKMPVALIDILAAHQLKEGILIALMKRLKTSKGSYVSVSLEQAAVASLANQASNWLMAGYDHQPSGSLHPNIAPYGEIFMTADNKKMVLAIGNDKQFKKLCELLNCMPVYHDERFINNIQRVVHREMLFRSLEPVIKQQQSTTLLQLLIKNDVPAGLIKSVKEVFDNPTLASLILEESGNQKNSKCVKTAVFTIMD